MILENNNTFETKKNINKNNYDSLSDKKTQLKNKCYINIQYRGR